ncbi:MAG: hypothetical protein CM1200mP41_20670 [Gammaproteobacteria bacterium]|nr:MAG: hypothetical protein CM1200mP41_20670 [Gammaproteobacteria bacterium]
MPETHSKINVRPMSVHIGAEIEDIDLTQSLSTETISCIREALLKWKVVFFRDQHLDHAQHVQFARHFGDLTPVTSSSATTRPILKSIRSGNSERQP